MLHLRKIKRIRRSPEFYILSLFIIASSLFPCTHSKTASFRDKRVRLGNEIFLEAFPNELQHKYLGLVINQTSILPGGKPLVNALVDKGINIQAIFSPEHGFKGGIEGGEQIKDSFFKNIKIFSLYGKTKKPTPDQMRDVDALVYDIQDVGTRFYTYITTLKYILEAAADAQIPVYVLDRPNPCGGIIIEGPLLQPGYESFIGAVQIPIRYGLTLGELAAMMKGEGWVSEEVDLHVVKMANWKREYFWEDTDLAWIPTSPNIPSAETAMSYPGTGLLGGIILNQGLGTPHPFLQFGAPWLKPELIVQSLNAGEDFGVKLEILKYTPCSIPGKTLHPAYENKTCPGIFVHIIHPEKFFSIRFTLAVIKALKDYFPDKIYSGKSDLDLLFGNNLLSQYLRGQISYDRLLFEIEKEEIIFREMSRKYLLYE